MNHKIDHIIKNSQHEKALDIRPELWQRLERRLDDHSEGPRKSPRWLVAASLFVVLSLATLLILNIDRYRVEDLPVDNEPNFSKEHIANLEELYHVPPSLFLNPEYL